MKKQEYYSIGNIGQRLGIPLSTIRYWENVFQDLWKPERSKGGQRRYSKTDIDFLQKIIRLSRERTLESVKSILKQEKLQAEAETAFDWSGKVVLVTGGTGSFGTAFISRLLKEHDPEAVRIYSRDELKQYQLHQKLRDPRLRFLIGDVRDRERLIKATLGVDVIVHAAAMKQVPACEYNPFEAIKTNVLGAKNVIDAALINKVPKVIALSTDKAVNPANLYGATKLCSDKMFIHANVYSGKRPSRFACVRYGNVLASRGSVIPLFLEQRKTGSVTITDPKMTRFWLTLREATTLVMKALAFMQGGEIFVPRIPSMRLVDLATAIAPECRQKVVGIRPGEKIHEVLISEEEGRYTYHRDGIFMVLPHEKQHISGNHNGWEQVPGHFIYASNTNDRWLSSEDLRSLLEREGILN